MELYLVKYPIDGIYYPDVIYRSLARDSSESDDVIFIFNERYGGNYFDSRGVKLKCRQESSLT